MFLDLYYKSGSNENSKQRSRTKKMKRRKEKEKRKRNLGFGRIRSNLLLIGNIVILRIGKRVVGWSFDIVRRN